MPTPTTSPFLALCGVALVALCAFPMVVYLSGDHDTATTAFDHAGLTLVAVMFLVLVLAPLVRAAIRSLSSPQP